MRSMSATAFFQKTYSVPRFVRHNNHGEQTQYMVKDHHGAIISREDFEAAHAFIHQRATEKVSSKGATNTRIATPSPGRSSAASAAIPLSAGYTAAPDTNTPHGAAVPTSRIKINATCFCKDDGHKRAFVTMMNKLVYAHGIILKPYVDALKNTSSDDSLRRIQEKHRPLLAQNTEKARDADKAHDTGHHRPDPF